LIGIGSDFAAKRLEIASETFSGLARLAIKADSGASSAMLEMLEVQTTASKLGLAVVLLEVQRRDQVALAFSTLRQPSVAAQASHRFFGKMPCLVGMEACATAHHWAREVSKLGHAVRLMPPSYVKGYVKRSKNDAAEAAAICCAGIS
jgi:hypothetical protein